LRVSNSERPRRTHRERLLPSRKKGWCGGKIGTLAGTIVKAKILPLQQSENIKKNGGGGTQERTKNGRFGRKREPLRRNISTKNEGGEKNLKKKWEKTTSIESEGQHYEQAVRPDEKLGKQREVRGEKRPLGRDRGGGGHGLACKSFKEIERELKSKRENRNNKGRRAKLQQ